MREQIISHSIEIIQKMLLSERTLNQGGHEAPFWSAGDTCLSVGQTGETLVCARADGEPLQPQSLTHQFTRLITRIEDLPRIRLHDLRHSHATQLLAAGVHPKIVQERLGHASITTTLDLYSHVTSTMQGDAAARLDAAFQPAIKVLKAAK